LIDVSVADGNVKLNGTVGSAAEKRRARTDAWVGGVKSVDDSELEVARWARDEDLRESKYAVKTDEELRSAVEDAFLYDPRVWSYDVTPRVDAGVVTLEGVVDNLKAKQAAGQDARNTVGVIRVENRLKVRPVEDLSDPKVADNVREALSRDPYVEKYEIIVKAFDGIVHLYGTVDSYFDKGQAEDVAYRSKGVTGVRNHLYVDYDSVALHSPYVDDWYLYSYPWYRNYPRPVRPYGNDTEIEEDIEDELWWSPFVDSDDVTVTVDNGTATLTGTVGSWFEYRIAAANAFEGGAIEVDNNLVVSPTGS
jgi:osmotically-inducible protein OsmY